VFEVLVKVFERVRRSGCSISACTNPFLMHCSLPLYITSDNISVECYKLTDSPAVRVCKQATGNTYKK